jgi:hypothetical protein
MAMQRSTVYVFQIQVTPTITLPLPYLLPILWRVTSVSWAPGPWGSSYNNLCWPQVDQSVRFIIICRLGICNYQPANAHARNSRRGGGPWKRSRPISLALGAIYPLNTAGFIALAIALGSEPIEAKKTTILNNEICTRYFCLLNYTIHTRHMKIYW